MVRTGRNPNGGIKMNNACVKLLETIAKGKSIALIGSGPSCAMGYPSWPELAKKVQKKANSFGFTIDMDSFNEHIENKEYAKAFSCLENSVPRELLLDFIKDCLKKEGENLSDEIYDIITRWPFICYLTTNFDNEIQEHLKKNKRKDFVVLLNKKEDFYNFRSDMTGYVFKIHGALEKDGNAVITEEDYHALKSDSKWDHYREGLKSVFRMFDVVVIGHSLYDPDINGIIESITEYTSPDHPIYMFLANVSQSDIRLYRKNYNITVFKYNKFDHDHSQLTRILKTLDSFILPHPSSIQRQSVDSLKAASLYSFRVLNQARDNVDLENFILMNIPEQTNKGLTIEEIKNKVNLSNLQIQYKTYLSNLQKKALIQFSGGLYNRTKNGDRFVEQCYVSTQKIEELAIETALNALEQKVSLDDKSKYKKMIKDTLLFIFERRGLILVQKIFSDRITSGETIDIFETIANSASSIEDIEIRMAFIRIIRDFILYPTDHQKRYLASISQGFFLFYMIGNNSSHADFRKEVFSKSYWFVDSNILIPLLAKGCFDHSFVVDLFSKFKEHEAQLYVTDRVLLEVKEHLDWAINNCKNESDLFEYATLIAGNKQNLFIDGFLHQKNARLTTSFQSYCINIKKQLDNGAIDFLDKYNIKKVGIDTSNNNIMDIFDQNIIKIESTRTMLHSYRSRLQVETEAELLVLMTDLINKNKIVYFLSQSLIFTKPDFNDDIKTWSGEAAYRYLLSLPNSTPSPLLHECLLNELYSSGICFIDKDAYITFFKEDIELAKLKFEEEKQKYIKLLGRIGGVEDLDSSFGRTPDLEKPLFVNQMILKIADISSKKYVETQEDVRKKNELLATKDEEIAKLKRQVERYNKETTKSERREKNEYATLRNSLDPKHVAKRLKQLKKRKRKRKHK